MRLFLNKHKIEQNIKKSSYLIFPNMNKQLIRLKRLNYEGQFRYIILSVLIDIKNIKNLILS